jgi:hypothetical protein
MPDREAPVSLIQNTFAAGEISPSLYGRTDLAKFHQAAAIMRNFYVDYKGGASSRPGTQYMGQAATTGQVRLIPFQFSATIGQTYMLVLSAGKMRFIKNPGTPPYPNSSNAGFIILTGSPYTIDTPYAEADLPFLHFSQIADQMWITRHGYKRQVLSRITDTNWTLTPVSVTPVIGPPTISGVTISGLPAGSPDPQNTTYLYVVTSVDMNGNESLPSNYGGTTGIDIATTQGTASIFWNAVAGARFYKVYKALPAPGAKVPGLESQFGFAGFSYGPSFTDSNIVADFTKAPPTFDDPFTPGKITGFAISASTADWPVSGTSLNVTDATGAGAELFPIISNNTAGGVGSIIGIYIRNPGHDYTAPTVAAAGGGTTFTATLSIGATSGLDPDVVGLFQQRQIYASSLNFPSTLWGSRPGKFADFTFSNPTVDNDSYAFTIAASQVGDILWLQTMPGGLVIGTNSGIVQLTGGSSSPSSPAVVTPSNAVIVPQSYYGSADIHPIVINYDILYVQLGSSVVRDLQYNFFVNIYTGTDITAFSNHLFYPHTISAWAYQDSPTKIVWARRDDGSALSLTYFKEQEVLGWAHHDTNGIIEDVAVVHEGSIDAVYLVVNRGGTRFVERMVDKQYNSIEDCWCLDAALSTVANWVSARTLTVSQPTGTATFTAGSASFSSGDVGTKVIRSLGGAKAVITGYTSSTVVTAAIDPNFPSWPPLLGAFDGLWRIDPIVTTVSGLAHLNGFQVYALADGAVQGPFTVSAGAITLTTAASSVVVGLLYQCQLQTLYLDAGEATIQGKRKKVTAATIRVKDAARVKYGTTFLTLREWKKGTSSTDPGEYWPTTSIAGLTFGDQRIVLDPSFNVVGSVCVQQDYPLPATVLAIIPEVAQGDVM